MTVADVPEQIGTEEGHSTDRAIEPNGAEMKNEPELERALLPKLAERSSARHTRSGARPSSALLDDLVRPR